MIEARERDFTRPIIFFIICFAQFCSGKIFAQQKVQFTQYMFNGLVINPAYAGADGALSLTLVNRSQWSGVEGAPTTQTFSGHTLFKKKQIGVGLSISNDRIGVHKHLNVLTNYAYHLNAGHNSYLSFGLQAGVHNRRSDYGPLVNNSVNDPKVSHAFLSHTFFDFGVGLYFRSPKLHIGFSIPELMPESIAFNDSTSIQLTELNNFLFSKYQIYVNENLDLEPSVLLKYLQGVPLSYDINMNFIFRKVLTTGLSYRKKESIDLLMKFQVTPQLEIGYSYDYPLGQVSLLSNASHEIMIHYLFKFMQSKVSSPR